MLKELIIKVDNQGIHLSPKLTVPMRYTNIPIEHCMFRTHDDIFWKVELLNYDSDTKCWKMRVVDYFANDIENYEHQKSTKKIDRITFEKFDWPKFEQHLMYYQQSKFLDVLHNYDKERYLRAEERRKTATNFSTSNTESNLLRAQQHQNEFNSTKREPTIDIYKLELKVSFYDASFMLGYVTFSKNIKEVGNKVNFKIKNDYLLAEFENIKSWFSKKLKTKKFNVSATITISDGKVTEVTATSPQISMIDAQLIDSIKYQRTIASIKSSRLFDTDKSLFTADEIFAQIETTDIEGNVFSQNEQDILTFLLDKNKTRNRKQLEYLSGSKQAENSKLKFTLHPNFGFLFFIEGKENNHFVWELLNSHATYMWSIDKSDQGIELQYKRIEASINTIRESGRELYKRAYRQNHHDNDLVFCIIEHDDIASNFVNGFVKWKHKLNEKIT